VAVGSSLVILLGTGLVVRLLSRPAGQNPLSILTLTKLGNGPGGGGEG